MKLQDDQRWQAMLAADDADFQARLAADPAYRPWCDEQHAADAITFDAWLDSPEGRAWLAAEEFAYDSKKAMGYAQ